MRTLYAFNHAMKTCCLVALVALIAAGPAMAQTTFGPFSATPNVAIPDNGYNGTLGSMASSTVAVSGVTGASVINIEVDVAITHTWIGDLIIKLQSPSGSILTLVSRPGGAETDDTGNGGPVGSSANMDGSVLTFSDLGSYDAEAMGTGLTTSQAVCTDNGRCSFFPNPGATAHPTQTFASLFGETMNGNWTLYVGDQEAQDLGTLNSWAIRISTVNPSILAFLGVALAPDGDCSDEPLPGTLVNSLYVTAGTSVCYFYYGENTGDVTLGLHDIQDNLLGTLANGLPYPLAPATAAYLAVGPVVINSTTFSNATWTAYNAGPTDVATDGGSATVFVVPNNDNCADAIALSCGDVVSGSTESATVDGPGQSCSGGSVAPDVWYTVTGTGYGIRASLCGSGYDTKLDIYTGSCNAPVSLLCNDDATCSGNPSFQSEVTIASVAGETYFIRVHGFLGEVGAYTLSLICADCNGDFGGTAFVDGCGVCAGGNTGVTPGNQVTLDMTDDFGDGWNDGIYEIYDNSDPLNPVLIASGDLDGAATGDGSNFGQDVFCLPDGCYLFTVGGGEWDDEIGWTLSGVDGGPISGGAPLSFPFSINNAACAIAGCTDPASLNYDPAATVDDGSCLYAPANDACADAIALSCGASVTGTTLGASEDGPTTSCTGGSVAADVWYTVVGTGADITVSLCGSDYDTKLDIYTGLCDALVSVDCNDDADCSGNPSLQSEVTFASNAGETYVIRVHGFFGAVGDFVLTVSCVPVDCNGDANGTAFIDDCNVCVGGNTGLTACVQDCNGDFGGTAFIDECDDCVGGNTGLTACIPIGVEEGLDRNLSVYPNPNNGQFIVELNGAEGVGTLNIMDMMGRRVYTAGVNLNGNMRQAIDLNVARGTYVLQVITESGIATGKVELH